MADDISRPLRDVRPTAPDQTHDAKVVAEVSTRRAALRWLPLLLVACALLAGYGFGLQRYFSVEALRESQASLSAHVASRPVLAAAVYFGAYALAVALSFPGASFLTIAGGFLFGALVGGALAVLAATSGAVVIFLVARTSLGTALARKAGPRMKKLRDGFQCEGFSYLLCLRLVPLFPFWVVNLAAALFGMRLIPYAAATAIGIVPATFLLAYFGQGLETAIDGEGPRWSAGLFISLALLGLLALLPVVVRKRRDALARRDPPQAG